MRLLLLAPVILSACAFSPEQSQDYVAGLGNFDVCRLTMGGPHARMAEHEARNRGVDCTQFYGAIAAKQANEAAAIQQFQNTLRPPAAMTCQTIPWGLGTRTVCR